MRDRSSTAECEEEERTRPWTGVVVEVVSL
jgi:hypothetical protein